MSPTIFNYPMLNRIYNFYQRQCNRSPEYFLTNFSGPNYCGSKLLINYENMPYIRNGEFIPKAKAQNSPYVKLTYVKEVEPFTLIMNDPDSAFPSASGSVLQKTPPWGRARNSCVACSLPGFLSFPAPGDGAE